MMRGRTMPDVIRWSCPCGASVEVGAAQCPACDDPADVKGRLFRAFGQSLCQASWKNPVFLGFGQHHCHGCASTHPTYHHVTCEDCGRQLYRTPPQTPEQAACRTCGESVDAYQGRVLVGRD